MWLIEYCARGGSRPRLECSPSLTFGLGTAPQEFFAENSCSGVRLHTEQGKKKEGIFSELFLSRAENTFLLFVGARGGSRTLKTLRSADFESAAVAISPPEQIIFTENPTHHTQNRFFFQTLIFSNRAIMIRAVGCTKKEREVREYAGTEDRHRSIYRRAMRRKE
jgi:hypothetical protein